MLLWLEEAAIEIAMILATAIGAVMFVGAVWYHVGEHFRERASRRQQLATQPDARRLVAGTTARPTGRHA